MIMGWMACVAVTVFGVGGADTMNFLIILSVDDRPLEIIKVCEQFDWKCT